MISVMTFNLASGKKCQVLKRTIWMRHSQYIGTWMIFSFLVR